MGRQHTAAALEERREAHCCGVSQGGEVGRRPGEGRPGEGGDIVYHYGGPDMCVARVTLFE
eukprot:7384842-Prymnesium_polylepis.1